MCATINGLPYKLNRNLTTLQAVPVACWLRPLSLIHLASRRCEFKPSSGHMIVRQAKISAACGLSGGF